MTEYWKNRMSQSSDKTCWKAYKASAQQNVHSLDIWQLITVVSISVKLDKRIQSWVR